MLSGGVQAREEITAWEGSSSKVVIVVGGGGLYDNSVNEVTSGS